MPVDVGPTGIADVPQVSVEANQALEVNSDMLNSLVKLSTSDPDPAEISLLANQYFEENRYAEAAELYERLLAFGPGNADVHNNLGLTLHYLGRSEEALIRLKDGLAIDSTNQRIWLTYGYVNSQTGDLETARSALTKAIEIDSETQVGKSAMNMLANLP